MAMSPQYAVLLLLQTEPGIDAVLSSGGPVRFSDLTNIAETVMNYRGEVRYLDPDLRPPDPEVLGAAHDSLAWLGKPVGGAPIDDGDASVLVVERARWVEGATAAHVRTEPFPDEQIVAGVIATPDENRLIVVPMGGGTRVADAVMLYGRHRAPSRRRWTLLPFLKRPERPAPTPVSESCELSDDPDLDCVSNGCAGNCVMELAYENRVLVKLGCRCH